MRRLHLSALIFAALALGHSPQALAQAFTQQAASADAAESRWTRYTYPGEEFSAELPGMPITSLTGRNVNRDWRKAEKVRVFSHYADGVVYFVVAYDNAHASESLDFFATYLRGSWGLTPKGKLTQGGFEGKSYGVVGMQRGRIFYDVHGEARVFRTKRRAYLALALAKQAGRPEVERFLNAFTLGAGAAGERIADEEPVARYAPPKTDAEPTPGADAEEDLKLVRRERAPGEPHSMQDVGAKALIVYKPEPPYTEEARKNGVTGFVRLRVVLNATGRVTDAQVLKPLPNGLTESAIRIARQMRFFPAEKDGRPVSQYVMLEYHFNIY